MHVFRVPPGWVAAAWTFAGLKALTLPRETPEAALRELGTGLQVEGLQVKLDVFPYGTEKRLTLELQKELESYFCGSRTRFSIPLDWSGYTPFQRRVLAVVAGIPYGTVRSYKWVAEACGNFQAARAVGGVMRSNRTPLVIPCHRVIGRGGSLGGFSGGLAMKKYLLKLEGVKSIF
ncbi:MAG: methylated-DNA--[protein]-cysteine S-methyltransferase [Peptococcaceae bacterium]|nr:MAG: methylated-DNA--[protein]-cysteine S-methyltransferase [Peptococcaceae bacterium]